MATSLPVQTSDSANDTRLAVASVPTSTDTDAPESALAGIARFFNSTLPDTLSKLTGSLFGGGVDALPVAISAIILLLTMIAVGATIYTTNYGGTLTIGRYNLTKFAQAHDLTQLVTFAISITGLGIVTAVLSFTIF